jgi:hypothetical protein
MICIATLLFLSGESRCSDHALALFSYIFNSCSLSTCRSRGQTSKSFLMKHWSD